MYKITYDGKQIGKVRTFTEVAFFLQEHSNDFGGGELRIEGIDESIKKGCKANELGNEKSD